MTTQMTLSTPHCLGESEFVDEVFLCERRLGQLGLGLPHRGQEMALAVLQPGVLPVEHARVVLLGVVHLLLHRAPRIMIVIITCMESSVDGSVLRPSRSLRCPQAKQGLLEYGNAKVYLARASLRCHVESCASSRRMRLRESKFEICHRSKAKDLE